MSQEKIQLTEDQQYQARVAEHVAAEMKPFIDESLKARKDKEDMLAGAEFLGEQKDVEHVALTRRRTFEGAAAAANREAEFELLANAVGKSKEDELRKYPLPEPTAKKPEADTEQVEKEITKDEIEPGMIVNFVHEDPDSTHDSRQSVLILDVRDGAVDFIGLEPNKPTFAEAGTKLFSEIGLAPHLDPDGEPAETHYEKTTSAGLRIPPKFHDKEEAANQIALIENIEKSQIENKAVPDHPPSLEGLATEALAYYTVEGHKDESYQKDLAAEVTQIDSATSVRDIAGKDQLAA